MSKKISLYDVLATDKNDEENGKWFNDIIGEDSGVCIKLRRLTAKVVERTRQRITLQNRKHQTKDGKFPEDIDLLMLCDYLSQSVIVDWKGVVDESGEEVPFSQEAAHKFCTDLPEFRRIVLSLAGNMEAFRAEARQEIEGNS